MRRQFSWRIKLQKLPIHLFSYQEYLLNKIMNLNGIKVVYYLIIPLLIVGISLGYTSFLMAFVLFIPLLFTTNRHTLAIFFVMYGGPLGGIIREMYPFLPTYGLLIVFLGFVLMWDLVIELFRNHPKALGGIALTLLVFGVFYYLGPKDEDATSKYITMCTHGILMVFAFHAFDASKKVDAEALTQLLLMASICMFTYSMVAEHMRPGALLDYNWFREQSSIGEDRNSLITYQQVGMLVLFSLAIFISQINIKRGPLLFYIIFALQLILMSGCRQAILGAAIVIALRFFVFRTNNKINKHKSKRLLGIVLGLAVFVLVLYLFVSNTQIDVVSNTISEGDFAREAIFEQAVLLFMQNPQTGVGIGGFQYITGEVYPHNFFLELLCETGLVGTISALLLLIVPLIVKKQGLLHITASNQFFFLILVGTFVRVMVSSDLTESIELFSAVFAISTVKKASVLYTHKNSVELKTI